MNPAEILATLGYSYGAIATYAIQHDLSFEEAINSIYATLPQW